MTSPIFGFNQPRDSLVDEVVRRVCDSVRDPQLVLNDAAYSEVRRLESKGGTELDAWRTLARSLGKMSEAELRDRARELCDAGSPGTSRATSTRASTTSPRAPCRVSSARSCPRGAP